MKVTWKRDLSLDVIKGVAIVLMVLGHVIEYGSGSEYRESTAYFDNELFQAIYTFHMPLFAMVSGYLFYGTVSRKPFKDMIVGKLCSCLLPSFSFAAITFFLFRYEVSMSIGSIVLGYLRTAVHTLWFLWALLYAMLITLLCKYCFQDSIVSYFLIVLLILFLPDIDDLTYYRFILPYFVTGWFMNKTLFLDKCGKLLGLIALACTMLWCVMVCFYNRECLIYVSGLSLYGETDTHQFIVDIYRWVVGFVGSLAVFSSIKMVVASGKTLRLLQGAAFLGKQSMGIYCFNAILCACLFRFTKVYAEPRFNIWVLEAVCVIIVSLILSELCKKFKLSRILLLGGR